MSLKLSCNTFGKIVVSERESLDSGNYHIDLLLKSCIMPISSIKKWISYATFIEVMSLKLAFEIGRQCTVSNNRKVASSRLSWLVAHSSIFRLFMKGKFDAYVLWPLAERVQNWIVDQSIAHNFTVIHMYFQSKQNQIPTPCWPLCIWDTQATKWW